MKTALITGGLGLIGSFIARKLIEDSDIDKVILLDHYGRYVSSIREDFTDYRKLRIKGIEDKIVIERGEAKYFSVLYNILDRYRPLYIYHLAALPLAKLQNLNTEEALEGTVSSTSHFLEAVGMLKQNLGYEPERFVYSSSSMVYGDFKYNPADEDHPTNPKEIYGTMKLAGEVVTRGLSKYFDLKSVIIRPSAVYGPTDMNRRVSQIFIDKAMRKEKITIQGTDEALDFTYVRDIAKGFVLAATCASAIGETFNITAGSARTLMDYVMILKGYFPWLEYEVTERDSFRPKRGTLSIEKARNLLSYKPDYDLEKGIAEYIEFIKLHKPNSPI
jgi:nucleoside-diphosphate-sugar epimerase